MNDREFRLSELLENFGKAMRVWIRAGLPVVSEEEFRRRLEICRGCSFFDERARLGLGRCGRPGCGCTKFKLLLGTEQCPERRWV